MSSSNSRETFSLPRATQQGFRNDGISKIPVELLGDIFSHVVSHPTPNVFELPSQPTVEPDSRAELVRTAHSRGYASCASPYAISHVCSHWREITLSSSNLWTHLRVVLPTHEGVLPLLHLWIERAKGRPLELSIQDTAVEGYNHPPEYSKGLDTSRVIFDLFLSLIQRWKSINISLPYTPLEHLLHPALLSSLLSSSTIPQYLESIRISTSSSTPENFYTGFESSQSPGSGSQGHAAVPLFASLLHQSLNLREATWGTLDSVRVFEPVSHGQHILHGGRISSSSPQTSSIWPSSLLELTIHQVHYEAISILFASLSSGCPVLQKLWIMKSEETRSSWLYSSTSPGNAPPSPGSSLLSSPWDSSQQSIARGHVHGRLTSQPSKILLQSLNTLFLAFEDRELPTILDAVILPSLSTLCISPSSPSSSQPIHGMNPFNTTDSNSTSGDTNEYISNSTRSRKRWSRLSAWAWCSLSGMLQRSDARLDVLRVGGVDLCEAGEMWQPYWR